MRPAEADFTDTRGDTWELTVVLFDENDAPLDVSGSTFTASVKADLRASTTVAASFDVDDTDADTGTLVLTMTAADTGTLPPGRWFWDLQGTVGSVVTTYVGGKVTVVGDVTV